MGVLDFIRRILSGPSRSGRPSAQFAQSTFDALRAQMGNVGTSASNLTREPVGPPPVKTLDLDAGQFAPISSNDARPAARSSTTVLNNPWWGRLGTIPPTTDERTLLIDRTLVAYGLLAPD